MVWLTIKKNKKKTAVLRWESVHNDETYTPRNKHNKGPYRCFSLAICCNSTECKHADLSTYIFLHVFGLDGFVRVVGGIQSSKHQPADRDMTHIRIRSQTNDSEFHLCTNFLSQPMFCHSCATESPSLLCVGNTKPAKQLRAQVQVEPDMFDLI